MMTSLNDKQFPCGAEWVRVDFHLHTKADKEFQYSGDETYNNDYVDALEKADIRLGAITNHNKFDFEEFKSLRATARKKEIGLLPGVELSLSDGRAGIHALIVFSDDWIESGKDYINPFLANMFPGKTKEEYEHENGCSEKTLLQMVETLDGLSRGDYFLIFAHVEESKGLWKELGMGKLAAWKDSRYDALRSRTLGFQKVRSYNKLNEADKPCRLKAKNALGDWYPAEVEGSDPKRIEEIGKGKPCFLKLGELSFDALKFALSDPASRVAKEPSSHTASHIRSLYFDGGVLSGTTLRFSPELNTLIGIRGSGKSSILEALRYVLDIPRGDKAQDTKYKDELIKHTLGSGGKLTLTACDSYGQEFTISRIFREASNVYLGGKLQPGVSIRETVLRRPIYFGQKDLSSTGEGFETDLVEKLVGEQLRPLRAEIEAQRQRVRDAVARLLKLSTTADQKRDYEAQLADARFRLKKFEEHGIAAKLQKRIGFQQDAAALKRIRERVENFIVGLNAFLAEHEDELRNAPTHISSQNPDFFAAYHAEFAQVIAQLDLLKQIESDTRIAAARLDAKQKEFETARHNLQEEFAQIERQLAEELKQSGAAKIQPDDFLQQQQRMTKAQQMLDALVKQEAQKGAIRNQLIEDLEQLNALWLKEFQTTKAKLDRVNANHTALQIAAEFKGDKEAALRLIQELFRGSNIREATLRAVLGDYADFGSLFRDFEKAKANAGSTPDVFERYFTQNLADLVTWQVPNRFAIRYRGKELKHHSLGQRASALLLYVLGQRQNDVIIIDQPEDDLDNQTIYDDVIKLIREMKPFTQFIFATHNANFPVLGDAEQVHACRYQDDAVSVQSGGIDARPIQDAIINIMEGGEEAFRRRKDVYNLWKPQTSSK
jgi:ABC-type cobalamin/Fe3+-siderophores transport system ATPase subunit